MKFQENNIETVYIKDEISRCEDIEELKKKIFPLIKTQEEEWGRKINEIIAENGYSKTHFAELCGVSRVTVDKWCKGTLPKNREKLLVIGMAANYDVERMNQFLQRYGRYPALYAKSLEDCVCIYVLNQGLGEKAIEKYKYILERIQDSISGKNMKEEGEDVTTDKFQAKLSEVRDEDELEQFITDNIALFSMAYSKLYSYIILFLDENEYAVNDYEMALSQGWSSSLRQCVSAIRQRKWYPTRNKIISLGLHLIMDHDQIDEVLKLAHMEPLCAKNIFESVIMYILDDASLNDVFDEDSDGYNPDGLCIYAKNILAQLQLPEIDSFMTEIEEISDEG